MCKHDRPRGHKVIAENKRYSSRVLRRRLAAELRREWTQEKEDSTAVPTHTPPTKHLDLDLTDAEYSLLIDAVASFSDVMKDDYETYGDSDLTRLDSLSAKIARARVPNKRLLLVAK